jgi:hypothetical protein
VGFLRSQGQALGITGAATHLVGRIPYFSVNPNLLTDVLQVRARLWMFYRMLDVCDSGSMTAKEMHVWRVAAGSAGSPVRQHHVVGEREEVWRLIPCLLTCCVCSSLCWALAVLVLLCCCMRAYV